MGVFELALIQQNPGAACPAEIFDRLVAVPVSFMTFEKGRSSGFIVVDQELQEDVEMLFDFILRLDFPIASAIPISSPPFLWDDERSMAANNSSGFNYRTIAGTSRLSQHAFGRAIDINPLLNPYIVNGIAQPKGAVYVPSRRGTIVHNSFIARSMKRRGWIWGGDWENPDYQHFEKPRR